MASKGIKGITIELGAETTKLDKALRDVNNKSRDLQGELKQVERLLKFDPGNTELIAQKQQILSEQVENTSTKLERLKKVQQQVEQQFKSGDLGAEEYRAFQREVTATEGQLNGLKQKLSKVGTGNDLAGARQDMSKFKQEIQEAQEAAKDLGGELTGIVAGIAAGGGISGAIEKALDTSSLNTKINISMDIPPESVQFVKDAINTISAYGVDAEEALEGVRRQFALNADASDEVNQKIVEGAGAITAAYNGIDFIELIQETNEIAAGLKISNEDALALVDSLLKVGFPPEQLDTIAEYGVQMQELGFSTAEIQSIFEKGVDLKTWNIDNLNDGVKEARLQVGGLGSDISDSNAAVIEAAGLSTDTFQKWGEAVAKGGEEGSKAMSDIADHISKMEEGSAKNDLATLIFGTKWEDQGQNMIAVFQGLYQAVDKTSANAESLNSSMEKLNADPAVQMQQALADMQVAMQPLLETIAGIISKIAEWVANNPQLAATLTVIAIGIGIVMGAAIALAPVIMALTTVTGGLAVSINAAIWPITLIVAAIAALIAIGILLYQNWDTIKAKTVEIWGAIKAWFSNFWSSTKSLFNESLSTIVNYVSTKFSEAKNKVSEIWNSIKSFFTDTLGNLVSSTKSKFTDIVNAVRDKMNEVLSKIKEIWGNVKSFFAGINLFETGKNIIQGLVNGVMSMGKNLVDGVKGVVNDAIEGAKNLLGIKSPSRVFMEIGEFTGEGLAIGLENMTNNVKKASQHMVQSTIPNKPIMKTQQMQPSNLLSQKQPVILQLVSPDNREMARWLVDDITDLQNFNNNRIRLFGGA